MQEITIDVDGVPYTVEYSMHMDGNEETVVVYLPDGSTRTTALRGLSLKTAIGTHVRFYANTLKK